MKGTPRWRRTPDNRRTAILTAALAEFEVKGLYGAKMDDIALAAGLSKGSIYRYFPDKFELYAETVTAAVTESLSPGGGGTPHDRQLFLRRLWTITGDPRLRAAHRLSLVRDPGLRDLHAETTSLIENALVTPLAALLDRTESESPLPQDAPLARAQLAIATLMGRSVSEPDTPESVDAGVAFLLRACELEAQSPQADGF